jgi:hypothetical protein
MDLQHTAEENGYKSEKKMWIPQSAIHIFSGYDLKYTSSQVPCYMLGE